MRLALRRASAAALCVNTCATRYESFYYESGVWREASTVMGRVGGQRISQIIVSNKPLATELNTTIGSKVVSHDVRRRNGGIG